MVRPLELKIEAYSGIGVRLWEQCNFQAVELTHISLCGTNLPVMNLSGHCGASTTEPAFWLFCGGAGGVYSFNISACPSPWYKNKMFDFSCEQMNTFSFNVCGASPSPYQLMLIALVSLYVETALLAKGVTVTNIT